MAAWESTIRTGLLDENPGLESTLISGSENVRQYVALLKDPFWSIYFHWFGWATKLVGLASNLAEHKTGIDQPEGGHYEQKVFSKHCLYNVPLYLEACQPPKNICFFRDFAIAHADTITSPTHRQHQRFTLTGSYVHTLAHEYALAGEFHRFTGSCSCLYSAD